MPVVQVSLPRDTYRRLADKAAYLGLSDGMYLRLAYETGTSKDEDVLRAAEREAKERVKARERGGHKLKGVL